VHKGAQRNSMSHKTHFMSKFPHTFWQYVWTQRGRERGWYICPIGFSEENNISNKNEIPAVLTSINSYFLEKNLKVTFYNWDHYFP
jgi:hypothetical protein